MKHLFAQIALAQIPKILTLCDRNAHSPTYGCFDRAFWQYKVLDFPCGMSQEFVYPLALAYLTNVGYNPFYRQPTVKAWAEAGILYAAASAHPDGSCDDYFPFERAAGATAFSLLACIESYRLLDLAGSMALADDRIVKFLAKRANWLAECEESGRLTNHHALIVLCLELLSRLLPAEFSQRRWDRAKALRLERILDWQSAEGWFPEYEGFDPGYHTLTISCLARIYQLRPDDRLREALEKAVRLAAEFVHPDGSYGGEYGSRNTYNFFPHGFELVGTWMPLALEVNDRFLQGLERGLVPCYADDRIVGHHAWNYLLAWQDFVVDRPPARPRPLGRVWLPEAQILVDRRQGLDAKQELCVFELYVAPNKGGVFKLFEGDRLSVSDTQFSLLVRQGKQLKNAVAHLVDTYETQIDNDELTVSGRFGWAKQQQMKPWKLIVLRLVMFSFGRFFPNLIRRILQKMLIVSKKKAPFRFQRRLQWQEDCWSVTDTLQFSGSKALPESSWQSVVRAGIGSDQTSIHVVMSRTYQSGQLQPWRDLSEEVRSRPAGEPFVWERKL